jgi:spore maturation protein CgeB
MKIVLLTTYYGPFLENFYTRFHTDHFENYDSHLLALMSEFFGDSGCTWHHLNAAGHDCSIIIANNFNLQKQWAIENDVPFTSENWQMEIPLAQIKKWSPDIFYNEGVFEYFGEFNQEILRYTKKAAAWMSTPFSPNLDMSGMSLVLSSTPAFVEQFKKQGIHAAYLLPAFDVRVLEKFPQEVEKDIPFSFVGGWSHVHVNRKEAIKRLVQDTPVKIWGYGYLNQPRYSRRSLKYYRQLFFPENRKVLERYQGEAWGLDMYGIYRRSLMTFNIHESLLQGLVGNMRMFEATGMGTMMLNEDAPNLPQLFVPGKEVETYRSLDEAVEKVKYFLVHPEKALEIGRNAQLRTSKDYNYTLFAAKLIDHFKQILS